MCAMCNSCGSELLKLDNGEKVSGNESYSKLNSGASLFSCKVCGETQSSPGMTPLISPTMSLSSSDSSVSSSSDFSVDVNSYYRSKQEEPSVSSRHEESNYSSVNGQLNGTSTYDRHEGSNHTEMKRASFEKNDAVSEEVADNSHYFSNEMEARMWDPPLAENPEDDVEGNLMYNDDDDEGCGDGINWGKPSSLSTSTDEGRGSYHFREEKQRALGEVVNGKFKALVAQLLSSIGIFSSTEDGENWVDIITSLSWEAASFLRPDAVDGKGMGLEEHVKVKCIATGTRSQSQVIRGLVFKKHAAHKHMPTKYQNPKLLLIRGLLGQSSNGLSSFDTMKQEADRLKSVIEMIEMCHPNVIFVEKTVSRDVQESILAKGMTLVFDMKLHRLERIALCTGSSIVATENFSIQKLKHCDSFHIEKFVEEHAVPSEGGKKPSKTLMFLEGCSTRLGCTILLKGGPSDELKKIKSIVQCLVLMAYHLILETSFLVDQRSMFLTLSFPWTSNSSPNSLQSPTLRLSELTTLNGSEDASSTVDVPISNGYHDEVTNYPNSDSPSSYAPYNPIIFSGFSSLSTSLKKVIGESFPLASNYPSLSAYFGINRNEHNGQILDATNSEEVVTSEVEITDGTNESKLEAVASSDALDNTGPKDRHSEEHTGSKDGVSPVVEGQSILVLMSRRNALRGTVCEQSHFSRITFYRNFDIPLGKFLQDNILNQKRQCRTCEELPEAHFYYYAHHNKQLTIQVKRLPGGKPLPGEGEGKIWMWGCCGKCRPGNGTLKSTKRVLVSAAARSLSFGKFLELSFSHHSSSARLSSCGHSFQRDFLFFFGLGSMAAMFRYSPVTTYSVSMPPQMLDFNSPIVSEWLTREIENVCGKGMSLFSEAGDSLDKIRLKFEGLTPHPGIEFSDIEEMLKQERSEFELSLETIRNGNQGKAVHKLLKLNLLLWELLVESIIWDQRLNSLLCSDLTSTSLHRRSAEGLSNLCAENEGNSSATDFPIKEIPVEDGVQQNGELSINEVLIEDQDKEEQDDSSTKSTVVDNIGNGEVAPLELHHTESSVSLDSLKRLTSQSSFLSSLQRSSGWFWRPFSEIRQIYLNEISAGYSPRVEPLNVKTSKFLPRAHQLISEEGSRLHIPLESSDDRTYIVSDYEGEVSSIIACALALLKEQPPEPETATDEVQNLIRGPSTASLHSSSYGSFDSDTLNTSFSEESRLSSFDGLVLLDSLLASERFKVDVSLGVTRSLTKGKYSVVCLYAEQFRDLRSRCCPSEVDFIASLARCRNWDAKGGKSKSVFAKTLDDRLIIKEIKKTEFESFEKFGPHYFKHMMQCYQIGNQTCLAKVLGIYQVTIRQPKSGKEVRHDLMVMENLSYGRNITRQYDLKGALHARFTSATDGSGDVLLDQNFVNDMNSSPLYISNKAKHFLQRAVWNDTSFLNLINVMDYSLLVGVDTEKRELVCGIIDYLRQYTWDKQLETWVKTSLYASKNVLPTVISPKEYKKRFRKFMSTHFLCVPDNWCSGSCEICGPTEDGSSNPRTPGNEAA